jgi:hypothetical protein
MKRCGWDLVEKGGIGKGGVWDGGREAEGRVKLRGSWSHTHRQSLQTKKSWHPITIRSA